MQMELGDFSSYNLIRYGYPVDEKKVLAGIDLWCQTGWGQLANSWKVGLNFVWNEWIMIHKS